jgi:fibronectin type 3 domain-containing protein
VIPFALAVNGNDGHYGTSLSFSQTLSAPQQTPPAAPTGLSASGSDHVYLRWNANSESDLAGYNVYRSKTPGSGYLKLNDSLVSGTSFTDTGALSGYTYYYVVTAVDDAGAESGRSSEVSAKLAQGDTSSPSSPSSLNFPSKTASTISMSWSASSDNVGVVEYRIERSPNGSTWTQVGTSTSNRYTDTV